MDLPSQKTSAVSGGAAIDLERLFTPRAIAVVGASEETKRPGGQAVMTLSTFGFTGQVYPVNPNHSRIQGLPCFADVGTVPKPCDVALIALPAKSVPATIEACGRAGIPYAVVLSAGFGEIGNNDLQAQLEASIEASGVRVVGPNCTGILNLKDNIFNGFGAGFRNPDLRRGGVAMVTQSGGFGYSVLAFAEHEGIGFHSMISTGNEADLNTLDMIEYLLESADVELVVCYMEGVHDGGRLRLLGQRALALQKPIVIWKVGNTIQGAKAALSHTANLTTGYDLYKEAFREGGFIEIEDVYDLIDVAQAFRGKRLPAGNRVTMLTTSGGAGVLVADRCEQHGLVMGALSAGTRDRLRELAPGFAVIENPVDLSAGVAQNAQGFNEATRLLLEDPNTDMAIVRSFPGAAEQEWAEGLAAIAKGSSKPVLISLSGLALKHAESMRALGEANLSCFATPGRVVKAAAALAQFAAKLATLGDSNISVNKNSRPVPRQTLNIGASPRTMGERESKIFLGSYGIPIVQEWAIALDQIDGTPPSGIIFPVVVKIDSHDVPHKTEAGAVRIGVGSESDLRRNAQEIIAATLRYKPDARVEGILVQEMAQGLEVIMGCVNDPVFGPYVLFGMGGVFSEVIRDTTLAFAPFGVAAAHSMIQRIKGAKLFEGYRGAPARDVEALADALSRLSWLAYDHADRIAEIDVNPVFVGAVGEGVRAADALIVTRGV
jgi:acyl-CoA synthetase (NDP forming)